MGIINKMFQFVVRLIEFTSLSFHQDEKKNSYNAYSNKHITFIIILVHLIIVIKLRLSTIE